MSGELEAAGALATAGAVGAAIEGREGGQPGEGGCPNCGTPITGRYCSNCGQHTAANRKLTHVIGEFLHGLWHLDTKTWRTLPMVVFRPGTLTRNYVYGKRARYLSPLTMFLFAIFLMFFAFSTIETPSDFGQMRGGGGADLAEARTELAQARAELEQARTNPDPEDPPGLEERLAEEAVSRAEAQVARAERQLARERERAAQQQQADTAESNGDAPPAQSAENAPNVSVSVAGEPVPENSTWQDELREGIDRGDVKVNMGNEALNARALRTLRNPDLALYQIQDAASKFSFLLAPLSLPFIALLFLWKRGVTLYDHIAYALYALAFAAILFSMVVLLGQLPWVRWAAGWLLLGLPVHMYFHLGGAYALGWFSALWRTFFMLIFAVIVASIFFSLVIILGLAG
ncbi:MAG: DUF3667 domain-containing protein [Hyphomonadaceae bacterium]